MWVDIVLHLLRGAWVTLYLTLAAVAVGLVLGLLGAVMRLSRFRSLRTVAALYVEVIRGTPLLVQLFIIYYGLPRFGLNLSPLVSAVAGLGINMGAYLTEVFRAALEAVDKGQHDAAYALGLPSLTSFQRVILPQAFIIALPPISNYAVGTLKDTALVSTIAMTELLREANFAVTRTFLSFEVYSIAAAIYLVMSYPLSRLAQVLEARMKIFRPK
jgi:ectoine/hydroxyectoine ABC transporter permease protein EhuC